MGLSISIIGHNEEAHLKELLPTLGWADEVVYVDCESSDSSIEVAKNHGCKTFSRPNLTNLNINKSFGIDQCTQEWVFYLDPDERIPDELKDEIFKIVNTGSNHKGFELNRKNFFFGKWLKRGSQYPDRQLRFFQKGFAEFSNQHVHEKLNINGDVMKLSSDLHHFPYQSVSQFITKMNFYTSFNARFLFDQGVRPSLSGHFSYLMWKPFTRFIRRYFIKLGCTEGFPGLFASLFDGVGIIVTYFKLWELSSRQK